MIDVQRYLPVAQKAQAVINQVLDNRPGTNSDYIHEWVLRGTPQNDVFLYAILDASRIPRPEPFEQATHHISSVLQGLPVYWGNSTGFRYAVVLSPVKRLPKKIELPTALPAGRLLIGQRVDGQTAGGKWGELRHMIIVGTTGGGKSVTLRSIVYQALQQNFHLVLADLDGTTFPMLSGHTNLLAPLATNPDEFISALQTALGELEHRSALYKAASTVYPENIEEYNEFAIANGKEPLKRVLVALDEYNSAVMESGGANGDLSRLAIELASRGRKFGISLVLGAQEFSREIIGSVRDQIGVVIAHKVMSDGVARNVGVAAAAQISDRSPGRAITNRWGQVQCYHIDKSLLVKKALMGPAAALNDEENTIAWRAVTESGGKISLEVLMGWGMGQREARRLQDAWKLRGWAANDPARANGLYITGKMPIEPISVTNRQTRQTLTNPVQTRQTNLPTDKLNQPMKQHLEMNHDD